MHAAKQFTNLLVTQSCISFDQIYCHLFRRIVPASSALERACSRIEITRSNRLSPSGCIVIGSFVTMVLLQYDPYFPGLLALDELIHVIFKLSRVEGYVHAERAQLPVSMRHTQPPAISHPSSPGVSHRE